MPDHPVCDVCSRTILKGEQLHEYVTPQGQRHGVCVLCRQRAEASGWIPAEQYGLIARQPPSRSGRGRALRERLGRAASRARARVRGPRGRERDAGADPPSPSDPGVPIAPPDDPPVGSRAAAPAREPQAAAAKRPRRSDARLDRVADDEARQPARRRPRDEPAVEPVPAPAARPRRGPAAIMRGAVERFNESDDRRKIAGLMRSLGTPHAAVVPDTSRQLALVTVAWELSWYQWEVNGENGEHEGGTVREVAKGDEVSELAEDSRTWNAEVAEDGRLRLRSSDREPAPAGEA